MSDHSDNDQRNGILAVGNLLIDSMKSISNYPREAMLTHIRQIDHSCGGGCMNVLFDLAVIDPALPRYLVGVIGNDAHGDFIIEQAGQRAINTDGIHRDGDHCTSFTDVMINQASGERTFFHYAGANTKLDVSFIGAINADNIPAKIAHLAYLLVLPELDQPCAKYGSKGAQALALLQEQGYKTSLDLVSDADATRFDRWVKPALPYVDYLIINDEEASSLTGIHLSPSSDNQGFERLVYGLMELGIRDTVIIHHPLGATALRRGGEPVSVRAYTLAREQVVSTLGAGDAFCAGALYGLHQKMSLMQCLKLGCAAARFNLFSLSATDGAVTYQALQAFIDQEGEDDTVN